MNLGEVSDYLRAQQALAAINPRVGRLLSLTETPHQEAYRAPADRVAAIQGEAARMYGETPHYQRYGIGDATTALDRLHSFLRRTQEGGRRALSAAETTRYLTLLGRLEDESPEWAARLQLHRGQ